MTVSGPQTQAFNVEDVKLGVVSIVRDDATLMRQLTA